MDIESYRIWLKEELSRKSQFVKNNEELCGCDLRTLGLSEYEILAPGKLQNKPNVSLQCIINHGHKRCHVGFHPQISDDKRLECEGCSRKLQSLCNTRRWQACGTVYCDSCTNQLSSFYQKMLRRPLSTGQKNTRPNSHVKIYCFVT